MKDEGHTAQPPSQRILARVAAGAVVTATLALFLFVLPVEFRYDPTGFGRLLGLDDLANAQAWNEVPLPAGDGELVRFYDVPFRTDTIDIPLPAEDGDLEYKVMMRAGDALVYSWEVPNIENPEWFYSEFHGHTEPSPGEVGNVTFYRNEVGDRDNGNFIAPFEGIHGWYLQNQTTRPVVVRLRLAGFYEEILDQIPDQIPAN